jgi:hypothetical protein
MQKVIYWSEDSRLTVNTKFIGVALIPVLLFFVPLQWIEHQHSICIYKFITGNECYGCGITRAILSAMHLKFYEALRYNRLFLIVLPLLSYIWAKNLVNLWAQGKIISA